MRKIYFIVVLAFLSFSLYSQVSGYSFSSATSTYVPLGVSATNSSATGDDGLENGIALGFSFNYGGTNYSHFCITTNGWIRLGTSSSVNLTPASHWSNSATNALSATYNPLIAAIWDDNHRNTGAIRYELTGTAPNRVLTIEWNNVNIGGGGSTSTANLAQYQIALFETTNVVELRYGTTATAGTLSGFVGLVNGSNFLSVTPAATPTVSSTTQNHSVNATAYANLNGKKLTFTPPSCFVPAALTATNTSGLAFNAYTLSWSAPGSGTTPSGYEWSVSTSATPPASGTATTATSQALTSLTPSTTYYAHVRSNCGGGTYSGWATLSFYTGYCLASTVSQASWVSAFSTTGGFTGNITYTAASGTTGGYNNASATNIVQNYVGATTNISMTAGGPTCGFAVWVDWNNDFTFAPAERVFVTSGYVTTTSGSFTVPSGTANGSYRMRVFTDYNNSAPSNPCATGISRGEFVDMTFEVVSPPACLPPTALSSSSITSSSADISWTAPTAGTTPAGYQWEVGATGFTAGTGASVASGSTTTALTANATGLSANTAYEAYVRTDCGSGTYSSWAGPIAFFTGYCQPSTVSQASWVSAFSTTGGFTGNITYTATSGTTGGYNDASASNTVQNYVGATTNISMTAGGPTCGFAVWVDWNNDLTFAPAERVFVTSGYVTTTSGSFTVPSGTANGSYRMRVFTDYNNSAPSNPCATGISQGEFVDMTFEVVSPPSCLPPTALSSSSITSSSADISWTAPTAGTTPSGYQWEVGATGFTAGTGASVASGSTTTALTANATGLSANTAYQAYVRTDCGGGTYSTWAGPIAFTTPCASVTDFTDNFEATTGAAFSPCWYKVGTTGTTNTQASTGITGSRNLYIGFGAVLAMPPVSNASANTHQFKLKVRANFTAGDTLYFGYLTNPTNASTFVPLSSIITNSATVAQNFLFTGVNCPSGTTTLAIRAGTLGYSILVDDVVYEVMPTCGDPTALSVSGTTATSTNINWVAPTLGSPTGYQWEVGATGFAAGTGASVASGSTTTALTASATGLSANTSYQAYVRTDCGGSGFSTWAGPINFTTSCNAAAIPFNEGFETGHTHNVAVANCWTQNSVTGSAVWTGNTGAITTNNRSPRTGTSSAFLQYSNEDWLFYPVDLTGGTSYTFDVYAKQDGSTTTDANITLAYGSSATPAGMTTITGPTGINATYQLITGNFTPSATGVYYIGIKGFMNGTPWYITLDDIKVDVAPSCVQPGGLTVSGITASSTNMTWTAPTSGTTPSGYQWEVGATGFTAGTGASVASGSTTTALTASATGLSSSTAYQVYVRTDCGSGTYSTWVGPVSFTTLCNSTATLPYIEDFSSATPPATPTCVTTQNAGTGNNWVHSNAGAGLSPGFTTSHMRYVYNSTNAADAWFYTQGLDLTAGKQYKVSFRYGNNSTTYEEKLEVKYGTSNTAAGMTGMIINFPSILMNAAKDTFGVFTAPTTGVYYIGFHAYSDADMYNLNVDTIVVDTLPVCNATANAVIASSSVSGMTAQCTEDATGWKYYSPASTPNQLMFGIKKGTSTLVGETVSLEILGSVPSSTMIGSTQQHGSFLMTRSWDVTAPAFTGTVDIRFFYDPADTTAANAARDAAFSALTGSSATKTPFEWFKTTGVPYNSVWRGLIVGNQFPSSYIKLTPTFGSVNGVNYVEFTGISSFSGGSGGSGFGMGTGASALPVTWAGFDVTAIETGNELVWKTSSEVNTLHFEVEYSYDGKNFMNSGVRIAAAGNSQVLNTYQYSHPDFNSIVYYRIKQVDRDKRTNYSATKMVKRLLGPSFQVAVYPIPVKEDNLLNVQVKNVDRSEMNIRIIDMNGRVLNQTMVIPSKDFVQESINVSGLSGGIYQLEVQNGQGREVIKFTR